MGWGSLAPVTPPSPQKGSHCQTRWASVVVVVLVVVVIGGQTQVASRPWACWETKRVLWGYTQYLQGLGLRPTHRWQCCCQLAIVGMFPIEVYWCLEVNFLGENNYIHDIYRDIYIYLYIYSHTQRVMHWGKYCCHGYMSEAYCSVETVSFTKLLYSREQLAYEYILLANIAYC